MLSLVMDIALEFDGAKVPTGSVRALERLISMEVVTSSAIAKRHQIPWLFLTYGAMGKVAGLRMVSTSVFTSDTATLRNPLSAIPIGSIPAVSLTIISYAKKQS